MSGAPQFKAPLSGRHLREASVGKPLAFVLVFRSEGVGYNGSCLYS